MEKHFMGKYFGKQVAAFFGLCIPSSIITIIVTLIFTPCKIRTAYIIGAIMGVILGLISIFIHFSQFPEHRIESDFWRICRVNNKKIHIGKCVLALTPLLVCSVILLILAIALYPKFVQIYMEEVAAGHLHRQYERIQKYDFLSSVIVSNTVNLFIAFIAKVDDYRQKSCKGCGAVMSYLEDYTSDFEKVDYTTEKKRDVNGTIGTLYSDGKKIGEVRGKVGTTTIKEHHHGFRHTSHCSCMYCGNKKDFRISNVSVDKTEE